MSFTSCRSERASGSPPVTKVADYIIGGWQVNTIATARSGQPYNITVPAISPIPATPGISGLTSSAIRISDPTPAAWFNTSAFAAPAPIHVRKSGQDTQCGHRRFGTSTVSVFRQFPFHGKALDGVPRRVVQYAEHRNHGNTEWKRARSQFR